MSDEKICKHCQHFNAHAMTEEQKASAPQKGLCRAVPPVGVMLVVPVNDIARGGALVPRIDSYTVWPEVFDNDFCGVFIPKIYLQH
jgi:hypothetical protein